MGGWWNKLFGGGKGNEQPAPRPNVTPTPDIPSRSAGGNINVPPPSTVGIPPRGTSSPGGAPTAPGAPGAPIGPRPDPGEMAEDPRPLKDRIIEAEGAQGVGKGISPTLGGTDVQRQFVPIGDRVGFAVEVHNDSDQPVAGASVVPIDPRFKPHGPPFVFYRDNGVAVGDILEAYKTDNKGRVVGSVAAGERADLSLEFRVNGRVMGWPIRTIYWRSRDEFDFDEHYRDYPGKPWPPAEIPPKRNV